MEDDDKDNESNESVPNEEVSDDEKAENETSEATPQESEVNTSDETSDVLPEEGSKDKPDESTAYETAKIETPEKLSVGMFKDVDPQKFYLVSFSILAAAVVSILISLISNVFFFSFTPFLKSKNVKPFLFRRYFSLRSKRLYFENGFNLRFVLF